MLKIKLPNLITSFISSFFIVLFLYFFNLLQPITIMSEGDELVKKVVNGIVVRYSRGSKIINDQSIQVMVEHFQHYMNTTPASRHQFTVLRYWKKWEDRFIKVPAYWHYHVNLGIPNPWTIHYNIAFTCHPQICWVEGVDYQLFDTYNILGNKNKQYVMYDLRIYDLNLLKIDFMYNSEKNFTQYILKHNKNLSDYFYNLNKYK